MLQRMYTLLLAKGDNHTCERKIRIRAKTKARYDDSLIATKDHRFYRVEGKLVTGNYAGKRLVVGNFSYPHAPALPFHKIWTHKFLGEMAHLQEIRPQDVIGKVVHCKEILTLMPHGALFG